MRKIYYANAEKINFGGLGLTLDVLNVTQNLSKQAQRVKNNFGKDALIKYHTNTIRIGNICPYKMQGEKVIEYAKQYQNKAVYLRDVIMWIEDSLTALNIWSSHAIPRGEEALINHEIIEDFRNDLNKLTGILVRNAIDDALSNTAKCETCGEPREWCIINTPYCEGNRDFND